MDETYMKIALKEAEKSYAIDDVPVGAIIVYQNKIIARAHNTKQKSQIAVNHAEIVAITKACKKLNSWHLDDCTMYVTMEPCLMCAGALLQSRISRLVYGTPNLKFGFVESIDSILNNGKNNHKIEICSGVCKEESEKMLKDFFKAKRG